MRSLNKTRAENGKERCELFKTIVYDVVAVIAC